MDYRSPCPVNLSVELLGDRWSIVLLRDIMFGNQRTYGELLKNSPEGIATNILAARLRHLEAEGLLAVSADSGHAQKRIYSLTEKAIDLVPVMAALGAWGIRHLPTTPAYAARSRMLAEGGAALERAFQEELRHLHLGSPGDPAPPSVTARMDAAFDEEYRKMTAAEADAGTGAT